MVHVNNAAYFTYFEQARLVAADTLGMRRALEETGLSLILVHGACDYKAQLKFGDVVDVGVAVTAIGRSSFTLGYEVRRVLDEAIVALGTSVQAIIDYEAQKSVPIPDTIRSKLETLVTGAPTSS